MTTQTTSITVTETLQHKVIFRPSYDSRNEDYGIHNMEITFMVIGPAGAVEWDIGSNWYVKTAREYLEKFLPERVEYAPKPYALSYHSPSALYEGQTPAFSNCKFIGGVPCYCDSHFSAAGLLVEPFLAQGEDYLWPKLEAYYRFTFGGGEWPFKEEDLGEEK